MWSSLSVCLSVCEGDTVTHDHSNQILSVVSQRQSDDAASRRPHAGRTAGGARLLFREPSRPRTVDMIRYGTER